MSAIWPKWCNITVKYGGRIKISGECVSRIEWNIEKEKYGEKLVICEM